MNDSLLSLRDVHTYYGASHILHGVSLEVRPGEVVGLLGRNGMGKTTTVKSVVGMLATHRGDVRFDGRAIGEWPSYRIAQAGVGLVPEMRQIFPTLTVRENLVACARLPRERRGEPWTLARVHALFPRLEERSAHLGSQLSGGEQQMLAIGRALMTNPRLLILDEATEGLAPLVRAEIWQCLGTLKRDGLTLIVIDKNIGPLIRLADRHYIVEKGRIAWSGDSQALSAAPQILSQYVGV